MRHKQRMRFHAAVCAVYTVVALVMAVSAHQEPSAEEKALTERMDAQASGLNKLTARAVTLGDIIDARLKSRADAKLQSRNMMQQLDRLGTGYCKTYEYNCGNQKCISDMLVCDYQDDCGNHADEDSNICDFPAEPGTSWMGRYVFYNCNPEVLTDSQFILKSFEKKDMLLPTASITGEVFWRDITSPTSKMMEMLPYEGIYKYADRKAKFIVEYSGQRYTEYMYFVPGEDGVLHYDIYPAGSKDLCGRAYMTQQE